MKTILVAGMIAVSSLAPAAAWGADSSYTSLDFDRDCVFAKPESEEEAGMGASAVCRIDGRPVIYFEDGDLRHSAGFGAEKSFQSFSQFNRMNETIEWRGEEHYAAIVRWFIENMDPDTGATDPARLGQVLVVSRVAATLEDATCIVGMVDARANKNANELARQVADDLAASFNCETDRPAYHGKRGPFAGDPAF